MRTYGVRSLALARGEIRNVDWLKQGSLVMLAAVFVALCAHIIIRLPYSPVPLTLQNFGVLMVGLMLGGKRGFAALLLYLAEGASELPVFTPFAPGAIAQLVGPTGGFLLAYPVVALVGRGRFSKWQTNICARPVGL
ncbi:MAG: biotin transporter BioY [Acidobacteria bacterium]|nr:biotin transporter BioY [Acidobacteriota bacterium]